MSKVQVDNIVNKADNGPPTFPKGANVVGIVSATSFVGSGANLTNLNIPASYNDLDNMLFG